MLDATGRMLALDPGSIACSVWLYRKWHRPTVAYNTAVVRHASQANTDGALDK